MLKRPVDAIVKAGNARRSGRIGIGQDRSERADLRSETVSRHSGRQKMHDVDRTARRTAAETSRTRPLQHLDSLDAVARLRNAVDLVAVRKPVLVNARVQTANLKTIEEAV